MTVQIQCPYCAKRFCVSEEVLGRQVACHDCRKAFEAVPLGPVSQQAAITDQATSPAGSALPREEHPLRDERDPWDELLDRRRKSRPWLPLLLILGILGGLGLLLILGVGGVGMLLYYRARTAQFEARRAAMVAEEARAQAEMERAQQLRRGLEENGRALGREGIGHPDSGEELRVEVLGNQALDSLRGPGHDPAKRYRVQEGDLTKLLTLEEVKKRIAERAKAERDPLRRVRLVLYLDSPAKDSVWVTDLENHVIGLEGNGKGLILDLRNKNAR
jgi:hypothetical protein